MERSGKVGRSERYSKTGRDTNISECDLLSVDKVGILRRCAMMIGLDFVLDFILCGHQALSPERKLRSGIAATPNWCRLGGFNAH